MVTQQNKAEQFAALHTGGTFIIPNPWDVGSAVMLQNLGFSALATTSAGYAQTLGRLDGQITLEEKLDHCQALADATSVPISVDFENGFADQPAEVAANISRLAETGVVGASIEDWSRTEIYDFDLSVERVQAAAAAAHSLGFPFTLTARAENLLRGINDLNDTIRRLRAYEEAGADVLYAPGLRTLDMIKQVQAETTKPLNVLAPFFPNVSLRELEACDVRRLSLGSALGNYTLHAMFGAVDEMLEGGRFDWTSTITSGGRLRKLLG